MTLTPEIIKRLSYIKSFYQFAKEQSKLPTPQNYISILMFHDSVELFLYLSAEHLNVNLPHYIHFMEYWEIINNKLNSKELTQKISMSRLNTARTSLKHKGNYPNPDDIEYFRVSTQNFFEENCPIIFGIEFSEISLLDIIQDDEVKKILRDAQDYYNKFQYKEALECIGIAFYALLENYKESKSIRGESPFNIGSSLTYVGIGMDLDNDMRYVIETVRAMQNILKPIIFNLDYRKYIKFRMYTPDNIYQGKTYYNKYNLFWDSSKSKFKFEKEQVDYCFKFVIESAIILKQFDFKIEEDFHYFFHFW